MLFDVKFEGIFVVVVLFDDIIMKILLFIKVLFCMMRFKLFMII